MFGELSCKLATKLIKHISLKKNTIIYFAEIQLFLSEYYLLYVCGKI